MSERSRPYNVGFYRRLQDDTEAIYYLQAAAEDSQDAFLMALENLAQARHVTTILQASELQRVALYQMLSKDGAPTLRAVETVLGDFGVRLVLRVDDTTAVGHETHSVSRVA